MFGLDVRYQINNLTPFIIFFFIYSELAGETRWFFKSLNSYIYTAYFYGICIEAICMEF